jgi:uncharacterized damage-inducible protein DinB
LPSIDLTQGFRPRQDRHRSSVIGHRQAAPFSRLLEEERVKLTEYLLAELEREAPLTKRALEAVPEGKDDWKPHAKSMPLGRLTALVATMPSWLAMIVAKEELDVAPAPGTASQFSLDMPTRAARVKAMEEGVAATRKALQDTTDAHLEKPWRLLARGQTVLEAPRYVMMQDSINHLAHHRGQLTVYLRLNEVPVPAIYGPTADDQRF